MLLQQIISGLTNGSSYALVAVGIVMIYKAATIVNFAHGEAFMIGAYLGFFFYTVIGIPYLIAFVLAVALTGIVGVCIERCYRPLVRAHHLNGFLFTVALAVFLKGGMRLVAGDHEVPFPPIFGRQPIVVWGIVVTPQQIIVLLFTLFFLVSLTLFFKHTRLGKSMRATSSNKDAACIVGINIYRNFSKTWALSFMIAAAGGFLIAPLVLIHPDMGSIFMKSLAAAVMGGFQSIPGCVIGGFTVGLLENIGGGYISTTFTDITAFLITIIVLICRPTGLLGKKTKLRV